MTKSNQPFIMDRLLRVKDDIREISREIQDHHNFQYTKAREFALAVLGFQSSYQFDRWFQSEWDKLESLSTHERRFNLRCQDEPLSDEPVYIFERYQDYHAWEIRTGESEPLSSLCDEIAMDGLRLNFNQFRLKKVVTDLSRICSIWAGDMDDLRKHYEKRIPHCSCAKSYAYGLAERADIPLYHLESAEDISMWANCWGGVAFFNEEAMTDLERENAELAEELKSEFITMKI
ncbi:MAG: hypothetical protein CMF11_08360 [Idiomarina sp.]|nr:hypothetical protein [Idiomarina sp.]